MVWKLSYVESHPDAGSEEKVEYEWIRPESSAIVLQEAGMGGTRGLEYTLY